jgi:2,4-dienoyl-CoA reductase (NADPH2)
MRFLGPKKLEKVTKVWMPIGRRVLILGGAIAGCQLAEFLVKRGRKVTVVDTAETLGEGLPYDIPFRLFRWLTEKGVVMKAGVTYEEITDRGLVITAKDGKRETLEADTIITTSPLLPNQELLRGLEGNVAEAYPIGDCRQFGLMHDAIADGSRIARSI